MTRASIDTSVHQKTHLCKNDHSCINRYLRASNDSLRASTGTSVQQMTLRASADTSVHRNNTTAHQVLLRASGAAYEESIDTFPRKQDIIKPRSGRGGIYEEMSKVQVLKSEKDVYLEDTSGTL